MADNEEIVRDVMRAQPAVTVTPPYQSPNGAAPLISGVIEGLGNVLSASGKGSGKAYNKDLYKLFRDETEYRASTDILEPEEINRTTQVMEKALKISGGDIGAIKEAIELSGFKSSADLDKKFFDRAAASRAAQYEIVETAGASAVGIDAPASAKMIAGINNLNSGTVINGLIQGLKLSSPDQQAKMIDSEDTIGLGEAYVSLRTGWRDFVAANPQADLGDLFAIYTQKKISDIAKKGVDQVVAQKIVNRGLTLDRISVFGEEGAKKAEYVAGLIDQAESSRNKTNALIAARADAKFLMRPFTLKVRDPKTNKLIDVTKTGADWASDQKYLKIVEVLMNNQALELFPQLASDDKQIYGSNNLSWMLTPAAAQGVNSQKGEKGPVANNIVDGGNQVLDAAINEKNSVAPESLKGKGYGDVYQMQKFLQELDKDAAEDVDTQLKEDQKNKLFKSIALGTNAETDNEGFWQIDKNGNLHYMIYGGPSWSGEKLLVDATESSGFLGYGSNFAATLRRNKAALEDTLSLLQDRYGFDKDTMYEEFNREQIKDSVGAQTFRSNSLSNMMSYYKNVTKDMSEEDINEVLKATNKAGVDAPGVILRIAGGALGEVGEGMLEAARSTGEGAWNLITHPVNTAEDFGHSLKDSPIARRIINPVGTAVETLTDLGLAISGASQRRRIQMSEAAAKAIESSGNLKVNVEDFASVSSVSNIADGSIKIEGDEAQNLMMPKSGTAEVIEDDVVKMTFNDGTEAYVSGVIFGDEEFSKPGDYIEASKGDIVGSVGKGSVIRMQKTPERSEKIVTQYADGTQEVQAKKTEAIQSPIKGIVEMTTLLGDNPTVLVRSTEGDRIVGISGQGLSIAVKPGDKVTTKTVLGTTGKTGKYYIKDTQSNLPQPQKLPAFRQ